MTKIVLVIGAVLVIVFSTVPVNAQVAHNYAMARILKHITDFPGPGEMYDVDLLYADSLYNTQDPHLWWAPSNTIVKTGETVILDCITDSRMEVETLLNCKLLSVLP